MNLPPLSKKTRATVGVFAQVELTGALAMVVVIKQGYRLGRRSTLVPHAGATIHLVDELWEPGKRTSIRYPADVSLAKPATDVVVAGDAVAPALKPVRELDVRVEIGSLKKALRVFGPRAWYKGMSQLRLSDPLPFVRQELRWEAAYGGGDELRNPLGVGATDKPETLEGQRGPAIEDPDKLIHSPKTRPTPAGFAALGPDFLDRRQYAGTMDTRWQEERFPLRPLDFDPRFFQVATPELVSKVPLRGGEPVELHGMHPRGVLRFDLPKAAFAVAARIDRQTHDVRPVLDTVLIEPQLPGVQLTWRTVVPCPAQSRRLREIRVWEKEWR